MTADIKINGSSLSRSGRQFWLHSASVSEDATGLALSDSFGGIGSVQAALEDVDKTTLEIGNPVELTFDGVGTRTATIEAVSTTDGFATLSGATKTARLNRTINATPVTTTLGDALTQYFTKCGLSGGDYDINGTLAARSMLVPGWSGNAWAKLKELAAVERFEIADVSGVVTVRPIGGIALSMDAHSSLTETAGENVTGRFVETHLYEHSSITDKLVYPPAEYEDEYGGTTLPGWSVDADIIEVSPGEPVVIEVPIMASLSAVQQPVCQTWVGPDHNSSSVYTVTTKDGVEAVDPAAWTSRGGKVTVAILKDTSTLRITVDAGNNLAAGAPYRLALSAGSGSDYSTLRIVGTGIAWLKTRLRQPTSIPDELTDNEIASSTDSMFVRTPVQAYAELSAQAAAASRSVGGLSGSLGEFPLGFGEVAGAIIARPDANYRVRTVTVSQGGLDVQADRHTTVAAHNAAMAGLTVAQVNAIWAGRQVRQHNLAPLRR